MKMTEKVQFGLRFRTHEENHTEAIPEDSTKSEVIKKAYEGFGRLETPPVDISHKAILVPIATIEDYPKIKASIPS